jgi:Predicted S-adenosylmethionine-dependent methyltransferase
MGKDKLKRFEENKQFECLYQPEFEEIFGCEYRMKGRWSADHFKNNNPIVLELGCGRGEYTVEMARNFAEKNFIGVDIKGARMWRGAKSATEEHLSNAAFMRCRIEFAESVFGTEEVSEIWITFPDPQLKKSSKRLTSSFYLNRYRSFLKKGGIIHLKTDSLFLHEYTLELVKHNNLELIEACNDIYGSGRADLLLSIKTHYEKQFLSLGMPITYLAFKPGNTLLQEPLVT